MGKSKEEGASVCRGNQSWKRRQHVHSHVSLKKSVSFYVSQVRLGSGQIVVSGFGLVN